MDPNKKVNGKIKAQENIHDKKKKHAELIDYIRKDYESRNKDFKTGHFFQKNSIVIDKELELFDFFPNLAKIFEEIQLKYCVEDAIIPNTLRINGDFKSVLILVWDSCKALRYLFDKSTKGSQYYKQLVEFNKMCKEIYENDKLQIILYGMKEYYEFIRDTKRIIGIGQTKKSKFDEFPMTTESKFMESLNFLNIQLGLKYNPEIIEIDTPFDFIRHIYQCAKATVRLYCGTDIRWAGNFNIRWNNNNENIKELWKCHLQEFIKLNSNMSEAIIAKYPTPRQLIEAYEQSNNGENLLVGIEYKSCSNETKKIGVDLSRKIFQVFTSNDEEFILYDYQI